MVQYSDFNARTASQHLIDNQGYQSVQSWKSKPSHTAPLHGAQSFDAALSKQDMTPRTVQSLAPPQTSAKADTFQFNDVIDVINPLHHLPVIGMVYRELTGDTIKPASQIIGGGLFGGPVGAITGTINAVAQIQTGKDVADNVLAMAGISSSTSKAQENLNMDDPESRLNAVALAMASDQGINRDDLPATAISFATLPEVGRGYVKAHIAEGRTAGNMIVKKQVAAYQKASFGQNQPVPVIDKIDLERDVPVRDAITQLSLPPMPIRQSL